MQTLLLPGPAPVSSQTARLLTVDTTVDAVDTAPGDGVCATDTGACSLRAAVQEANRLAGPDTIVLPAGTYSLTIAGRGEDDSVTGDLDVIDTLTIAGAGSGSTVIAGVAQPNDDRVFDIHAGDVKLAGLTIRDGAAFNTNNQRTEGGGIAYRGGVRLTLVDVALRNNFAGQGGGLWVSGGTVIVKDSLFEGNATAEGGVLDHIGGAIYVRSGVLLVSNSAFRGNHSSAGGAIGNDGSLTLANVAILDNRATPFFSPCLGGGLYNRGTLSATHTVLAGNVAGNPSGCEGKGAGLWNSGTAEFANTTIGGNSATGGGGGIFNGQSGGAVLTLRNVTLWNNAAGVGGGIHNNSGNGAVVNLVNTLIAGNKATGEGPDCSGTLVSQGHNLLQKGSGGCTLSGGASGDITNMDPLVGPLADNGGSTLTHALLPGSPAIDAGDAVRCPPTDQRSVSRPQDGNGDGTAACDIGAYELEPALEPLVAVRIAAASGFTCAITAGRRLMCWGGNTFGTLGTTSTETCGSPPAACSTSPIEVKDLAGLVESVDLGVSHACALTAPGVKCWGANLHGQVGNGTMTDTGGFVPAPTDVVTGPDGATLTGVIAVAAGGAHSCALTAAGGMKCWGDNWYGELGDASAIDRPTPVDVRGLGEGVVMIAAQGNHTCALVTGGVLTCWGRNGHGQVGNGAYTDQFTPAGVTGLAGQVSAVGSGPFHTCALTTAGGVRCWGSNEQGQLGDGTICCGLGMDRNTPVDVLSSPGGPPLSGITAVAMGDWHTCALTTAGGVKCWGSNEYGQLGDGSGMNHLTPVDVLTTPGGSPLVGATAIASGGAHTCALFAGGAVRCWGGNAAGQLGDGTLTLRSTPVTVKGFDH